jgi:hypothetical protein
LVPAQQKIRVVTQVKISTAAIMLLAIGLPVSPADAQDLSEEVVELRQMIIEMRDDYERRIGELETRLDNAERAARGASRKAGEAIELAEETAIGQSAGSSAPNTFNPAIGTILTGQYADVGTGWDTIPGFQPGGEIGTGGSGFALGEAEINMKASIDAKYFGNLTFALHEEDGAAELELEEAWMQTTDLPAGLSLTGGRFFSETGYINDFHFHADDFVDRPLPYQAFLGGRYAVDGLQARWLAPTALLFELGTELNWGGNFPATANDETSPGAWTLFTKVGGDIGDSNSWQLGLSHINADVVNRAGGEDDMAAPGIFTGDSDLTVFDVVWKWAPRGNPTINNFKIQAEYFRRDEEGIFDNIPYDGEQTGWYVQGLWQFARLWRVGLRHDVVDADNGSSLDGTDLETPGRSSRRTSAMLDWSPSEFSRLRLQYTDDRVLPQSDNQWYLQYIMSIGAHGAHQF